MSDGNAQEIVRRDAAEENKDEGRGQVSLAQTTSCSLPVGYNCALRFLEWETNFMKWEGRLHAFHNDYVFATMEANYQQQASRDRVMPQLLDAQQELQEYYVEDWWVQVKWLDTVSKTCGYCLGDFEQLTCEIRIHTVCSWQYLEWGV